MKLYSWLAVCNSITRSAHLIWQLIPPIGVPKTPDDESACWLLRLVRSGLMQAQLQITPTGRAPPFLRRAPPEGCFWADQKWPCNTKQFKRGTRAGQSPNSSAGTSIFGKSLDQSTPLCPLPGNVVWCDGVALEAWVPSILCTITESLCVANYIHTTVIAILLSRRSLLCKGHFFAFGPQKNFQFGGNSACMKWVAPTLWVIVGEEAIVTVIQ